MSPAARSFATAGARQGRRRSRHTAERERRVSAAAAEAAEDDPAFAADAVKSAASQLFEGIQTAWAADDRATLHRLVAPTLAREWDRRLDDFARRGWRNRVETLGEPRVEYVGLDATAERVVVRIEAKLRDYVEDAWGNHMHRAGRLGEIVKVREFWTLTRRNGGWLLTSIEQGAEGVHALEEKLIATPWSDDQSLRDEALIEGATADTAPNISELAKVDYGGDAHGAALDLSLADGRFAPEVLEIAIRRAADAWAAAIDGDAAALRRVATATAAHAMLHPDGDRTRLVVRGPRVDRIRITAVERARAPADDDGGDTHHRPPVSAGSRHHGDPGRQSLTGGQVHRALDVRAHRVRPAALADLRRRLGVREPKLPPPRDPAQGQHPDGQVPVRHRRSDRGQRDRLPAGGQPRGLAHQRPEHVRGGEVRVDSVSRSPIASPTTR